MLFISGVARKWSLPADRTGCSQIYWRNEVRGQTRVEYDLGHSESKWNKSSEVSFELSFVKTCLRISCMKYLLEYKGITSNFLMCFGKGMSL